MRDIIAIQHGFALVAPGDCQNQQLAATLQAELMNLGVALDLPAYAAAAKAPREWLIAFHGQVIPYLRKQMGTDRQYRPMYAGFPGQVMEMSNLELFLNAVVHYLSDGRWEPPQALCDRGITFERSEFRVLRLGTDQDLKQLFTKLVSMNQSLTPQDRQAVTWLIDTYGPDLRLPEMIPFKETLCILAAKRLPVPIRTATDVLRVAVFMSGGDVSLPAVPKPTPRQVPQGFMRTLADRLLLAQQKHRETFKFRKFARSERRYLLELLEKTNPDVAEMQRHLGRWLRLGEILHVGEYGRQFPKAAEAFHVLRNQCGQNRVRTFAGRVDLAFAASWQAGLDLLANRPGEFARKLDWMLRNFDQACVLSTFARISPQVSAKVLLELHNHFGARATDRPRVVMLKGARAKMKTLPSLPPMEPGTVEAVRSTIDRVIRERISRLPPLGRVWIDERLKHVPVPFAMRSMNTAVRTYVRGTRIPFRADARVVRAFIHWLDEAGVEDLDLSAGLYSEALKGISHISFTNLKADRLNCCHSGDIRHRKGPCAEYVDIDIQRCLAAGIRYAIIQVFNYDGRPMHTVKNCVMGLMEREDAVGGEIFLPKSISNCMALANEGTSVVACIVDLQERHYIWADVEADRLLATLENTASRSLEVLKSLIHGRGMSVYQLLQHHAEMRGSQVPQPERADLVLRWEDFVTDYAGVGKYMSF